MAVCCIFHSRRQKAKKPTQAWLKNKYARGALTYAFLASHKGKQAYFGANQALGAVFRGAVDHSARTATRRDPCRGGDLGLGIVWGPGARDAHVDGAHPEMCALGEERWCWDWMARDDRK